MIATVIYHSADFDGIVSGAIALKALTVGEHKPRMIGWDYGDPVPTVDMGTDLFMLDISVEGLMDHPHLTWVDHHKTAIDKWDREDLAGIRIDGVAACRLAWQYFMVGASPNHPTKEEYVNRTVSEPLLVRLAGEYDVWDKRDKRAETLQYGLRASGFSINDGHLLADDDNTDRWVYQSSQIEEYSKITRREVAKRMSYRTKWYGLTFCVLNGGGSSLHFEGADMEGVDALMSWVHDGSKVKVSLYHAPGQTERDLSEIAKDMGGGGHRGACGFYVSSLTEMDGVLSQPV